MEVSKPILQIKEIEGETTWSIRHKVMWPTKPLAYVQLPEDDKGLHYGLFSNTSLVSVVSLFITEDVAQFRKLATVEAYQGRGLGSLLLARILDICTAKHIKKVWCNARKDKLGFYTKYGFNPTDKTFIRGGISYIILEKEL